MPGFNGNGVYIRYYNWTNDAASNIKIRADRFDTECDGYATGLSSCITKDGQTTITANLPMAGFIHAGVGAGTARTHYARLDQVQDGNLAWVAAGGTADAITASYTIPITTLIDGQLCFVRAGAANATTTPTFSPSALTARTITKYGGQALAAGDIYGAGHELVLRYRLSATRWELLNPAVSVASATTTTQGIVELATTAEAAAGTDTSRAITADGLALSKSQMLQNSQSADYTLVLTDAGKQIFHPSADTNNRTWTIPANSSVAFPVGTMITFTNMANTITIAITSDTLVFAGPGSTGSRSLAANATATIQKMTTTSWMVSGAGLS